MMGTKETEKIYGSYPLTDSIHIFGGLDKTTSTGVTGVILKLLALHMNLVAGLLDLAHFQRR